MNPRLSQFIGVIFLVICAAMSYLVYQSTLSVEGEIGTLIASGLIAWAILGLPELLIGLWLITRSARQVSVSFERQLLHLLHAQRRMTFDEISKATDADDDQIIETLESLSEKGRFRGTIDKNSRVVFTAEAVEHLPKAVTQCPNCDGKLENPILPGEEEDCPYCGHPIVNRLD